MLGVIERAAGLPDYWEEEEDEGGDGGHEVKVDQAPPGLEHLEEDLELTGQRVNQDLLLQLILWDCWAIKLYARFLQKTIPDSSSFSWRSYFLLEFCRIFNKFLQRFFLPLGTQMIHHLQKTFGSFTQLGNNRIIYLWKWKFEFFFEKVKLLCVSCLISRMSVLFRNSITFRSIEKPTVKY